VPRGGTAIAQAIEAARDMFAHSPAESTKVLLILTDGEDHEGDPIAAAQEAYESDGIRTFAIGVGDPSSSVGAQVPMGPDPNSKPLLHDGQIVFSKLDVTGLQAISRAGGGQFAAIRDLPGLVDALAAMHGSELGTQERIRHVPRYPWFLAAALFLLFLEQFISERRAAGASAPQRVWQQEAA
jgi:Ca-activated chloride channel family protein